MHAKNTDYVFPGLHHGQIDENTRHDDLVRLAEIATYPTRVEKLLLAEALRKRSDSEYSLEALLRSSEFQRAVEDLYLAHRAIKELDDRLEDVYEKVVEATVEHEGCAQGKKEFLERLNVPVQMWPMVDVRVTITRVISVPGFESDLYSSGRESVDEELVADALNDHLENSPNIVDEWDWDYEVNS